MGNKRVSGSRVRGLGFRVLEASELDLRGFGVFGFRGRVAFCNSTGRTIKAATRT